MARVIITGDRRWECVDLAKRLVQRMKDRIGDSLVIVHGGAAGIDDSFATACVHLSVYAETHQADWDKHGNAAGPIRNQEMVDAGAAFCVACHRFLPRSRGTRDCVQRCLDAGIPVYLIDSKDAAPRRIRSVDDAKGAR